VFIASMFSVFWLVFNGGEGLSDIIESCGEIISQYLANILGNGFFAAAMHEGIIPGVVTVVSFLPKILILFFCISFLERSGYMARITFLIDGILHAFGMHGKSAVPLISGLSCSVSAYTSARILQNKAEKIATMFAIGVIPCSAKMTLFAMLTGAFFGKDAPLAMLIIYLFSILLAIVLAKVVSLCFGKQKSNEPFVMELPKYRLPDLGSVFKEMIIRSRLYLKNAGTFIAAMAFGIWLLSHIPANLNNGNYYTKFAISQNNTYENSKEQLSASEYIMEESVLGAIGKAISPVLNPLGFDWKMNVSFLAATAAKEVAISTFSILYQSPQDDNNLAITLHKSIPLPAMVAYLMFMIVYVPCTSAIVMFHREAGNKKYTIALVLSTTIAAWFLALIAKHITSIIL